MHAIIPGTAYGVAERVEFAVEALDRPRPTTVLDVGCGTGTLLTAPLAARFPDTHFHGIDSDPVILAYARTIIRWRT